MILEGSSACEVTVVHEVRVGSMVQQLSIEEALLRVEQESIRFFRSIDTEECDTFYAVLDLSFLIKGLVRSGAERYAEKLVNLLHCE